METVTKETTNTPDALFSVPPGSYNVKWVSVNHHGMITLLVADGPHKGTALHAHLFALLPSRVQVSHEVIDSTDEIDTVVMQVSR